MATPLIITKAIQFQADPKAVWNLLTNPEMTQQYMFGCAVLSDWQVGQPILWQGKTEDGKDIIYVKGEILVIEQGTKVTFSMFDPNMGLEDVPSNYVNLTYELKANPQGTLLTLTQGDYAGVEKADSRYADSIRGWEMVIPLMQKLLS